MTDQAFREWAESVDRITKLDVTVRDEGAVAVAGSILDMNVRQLIIEVGKSNAKDALFELKFKGGVTVTLDVHVSVDGNETPGGES